MATDEMATVLPSSQACAGLPHMPPSVRQAGSACRPKRCPSQALGSAAAGLGSKTRADAVANGHTDTPGRSIHVFALWPGVTAKVSKTGT